jgi:antimicrobial peptide system SdpB family protein
MNTTSTTQPLGADTLIQRLDRFILARSPFNPVLGWTRTLLALATTITLVATPTDQLFFRSVNYPDGVVCGSSASEWSLYCLAATSSHFDLVVWGSVAVLLLVASGIAPRWTAIPHWYVAWSFSVGSPIPDGGDHITSILTLLLVPLCLFDRRRWHWSPDLTYSTRSVVVKFAAYGILALWVVQIFVLYFQAAVAKFGVTEWADGSALWYWMQNPTFGPTGLIRDLALGLLQYPAIVLLVTYGTLLFQVTLAFSVLFSWRWRRIYLVSAVLFHLGIAVTMGLWSFSTAMIAADLIFLIRPGEPLRHPWLSRGAQAVRERLAGVRNWG